MPRPRKDRFEQRSQTLHCRLRPVEYIRLQQVAIASGKSLSDYVRSRLLDGRSAPKIEIRTLDPVVFDQLRRIGVNLNQAVHKLHATGQLPPELASAAATVERFILEAMGDGSQGRR